MPVRNIHKAITGLIYVKKTFIKYKDFISRKGDYSPRSPSSKQITAVKTAYSRMYAPFTGERKNI